MGNTTETVRAYTCIPLSNCIYNNKGDSNLKYALTMKDDLIEIIQKQQYYIENNEHIDSDTYSDLMHKMSLYYGVRPNDIRFIQMEIVGPKALSKQDKERGKNSNSILYKGFTIRGRKQGYGK